jgi:hypothetical protein
MLFFPEENALPERKNVVNSTATKAANIFIGYSLSHN